MNTKPRGHRFRKKELALSQQRVRNMMHTWGRERMHLGNKA